MEEINWDYELERIRQSLDPQESRVIITCNFCGNNIYDGQDYFETEGNILCENCFDEQQSNEKSECRRIAGED